MGLINYFINDPLRILTVIGGSGGLIYWYDRCQNRSRLKIRLHTFGLVKSFSDNKKHITFEAENYGTNPMSLEPYVLLKGIVLSDARKGSSKRLYWSKYRYDIQTGDRNLPPHKPIAFKATCDAYDDGTAAFLIVMTYTFLPTRGRPHKIRFRAEDRHQLSYIRYVYEVILYVVFGKLVHEGKETTK